MLKDLETIEDFILRKAMMLDYFRGFTALEDMDCIVLQMYCEVLYNREGR